MIFNEAFMKKIKDFGLNSYEAKTWVALLSRGVSTAGELSDIANIPRSRSYDILESLEKKGFIIMKLGKPIKYLAIPPEEVIERVKKKVQLDAKEAEKSLEEIKTTDLLKELNQLHTKGIELVNPTDLTGAVKGRNNSYNQLNSMLKEAEKEVILTTTEEGLTRKAEFFEKAFKKLVKRGVKIKIAAPLTTKNKEAKKILSNYAEIKDLKKLDARFCIVDAQELLFMLTTDEVHKDYDVAVWVNAPFFAKALAELFELSWSTTIKTTI